MNKSDLIKEIKEKGVYKQNSKASFLGCTSYFSLYAKIGEELGLNTTQLCFNDNNKFFQYFFWDEIKSLGDFVYKKIMKEGMKPIYDEQEKIEYNIEKLFSKEKLNVITLEDFHKNLKKFFEYLYKWMKIFFMGEDKGQYFEERVLKNFKGTQNELYELTHPSNVSDIVRFPQIILEEALNPKTHDFKKIHKEFYWINTDFLRTSDFTKEQFDEMVTKQRKKGKETIKKEINKFKENLRKHSEAKNRLKHLETEEVKRLREFVEWSDIRKRGVMKSFYFFINLAKKAAELLKVDEDTINSCFLKEVIESTKKGKLIVDKEELKKRNVSFINFKGDNKYFWYGEEAKEIFQACQERGDNVKGMVACKGKVRGKVRVVLDFENKYFEEGEILVTSMTRPEFVPLMRKAAGVITDEGGIACHAAIVSRELNIPCVIGTKNATIALKTGDYIELDAEKGVVRKIEND